MPVTLLLGVDRDHRLTCGLGGDHRSVDVLELGITIGIAAAFEGLAVRLPAVLQQAEQLWNAALANLVTHRTQRRCQLRVAFRDPQQRSHGGRTGSPIVAGSSSRRRSSSNVGSVTVSACLPLPGRRTTPDSASGSSRFFRPRPIMLRAIPVARAAALIPPCPAARASAATNSRRPRTSRLRRTAAYRSPIADASTIGGVYAVINRAGIAYSRPRQPDSGIVGRRHSRQAVPPVRTLAGSPPSSGSGGCQP